MVDMLDINLISRRLDAQKKHWTIIAKEAGLSRKTLERIAANETDPRVGTINKINEVLLTYENQ